MEQPGTADTSVVVTLSTGEKVHIAGTPQDLIRTIRDADPQLPFVPVTRIDGATIYLGKEQMAMVAPPAAGAPGTPSTSSTSTTPDLADELARARHPNDRP